MNQIIDNPDGATPLSPDDLKGLRFPYVQTRGQLNELEASNIADGQMWASRLQRQTVDTIFQRDFVNTLHVKLFGSVWDWAGTIRNRELNIGVEPSQITVSLHNFLEDAKCWIEFNHYDSLELSARIQHRLVQIHPFVNGNGRHSRIFTDIVRGKLLQLPPLIWSTEALEEQNDQRGRYIASLREADKGDFEPFLYYLRDLALLQIVGGDKLIIPFC